MPNILLAVSGSVAAIKLPLLCECLRQHGELKIVCTDSAHKFIEGLQLPIGMHVIKDAEEWSSWNVVGDEVLHIELRRWADVMVIAPLSANTMAKLACGISDNLLTCVVRAWDWKHRPLVVAPAMNTLMWDSPFTQEHVRTLLKLGAVMVPPVAKMLACGDVGLGAMASPGAIAEVVDAVLAACRPVTVSCQAPEAAEVKHEAMPLPTTQPWALIKRRLHLPHNATWYEQGALRRRLWSLIGCAALLSGGAVCLALVSLSKQRRHMMR